MSHAEFAELSVTLEDAKDRIRPYRGIFEADWLLSDFNATVWKTKSLDSAQVDGDWVNTMNIDWSVQLPNGELLTDRKHTKVLTTLKKAAFLVGKDSLKVQYQQSIHGGHFYTTCLA